MRKTKHTLAFTVALVPLALWASPAASMMGFDGPPPCESKACFIEAVSAFKAGASYMTGMGAGASVQYMIDGATEDEGCQLGMVYTQHPESE